MEAANGKSPTHELATTDAWLQPQADEVCVNVPFEGCDCFDMLTFPIPKTC